MGLFSKKSGNFDLRSPEPENVPRAVELGKKGNVAGVLHFILGHRDKLAEVSEGLAHKFNKPYLTPAKLITILTQTDASPDNAEYQEKLRLAQVKLQADVNMPRTLEEAYSDAANQKTAKAVAYLSAYPAQIIPFCQKAYGMMGNVAFMEAIREHKEREHDTAGNKRNSMRMAEEIIERLVTNPSNHDNLQRVRERTTALIEGTHQSNAEEQEKQRLEKESTFTRNKSSQLWIIIPCVIIIQFTFRIKFLISE